MHICLTSFYPNAFFGLKTRHDISENFIDVLKIFWYHDYMFLKEDFNHPMRKTVL